MIKKSELKLVPEYELEGKISQDVDVSDLFNVKAMSNILNDIRSENKWLNVCGAQMGIHERICNIGSADFALTLINPVIIESSEETNSYPESTPFYVNVALHIKRPDRIKVEYITDAGEKAAEEFTGYTAKLIQQSIDLMNGISIRRKASRLKWDRAIVKHNKMVKKITKYLA